MAKKLNIKPEYKGKSVYTHEPKTYKRKEGGKFILNDELSQKDRRYLLEVMGLKTHFVEVDEPKKASKVNKQEKDNNDTPD